MVDPIVALAVFAGIAAAGDGVCGVFSGGPGLAAFRIGKRSEELVVNAGEVLHLPSNVPHKAEALEDTLDVDVFSPPRQDWLDGTDTYFHQKEDQ